ncbi:DNA-binding transcriptional LysR family regulator [Pseudomonas migulae]|jgi:DNA-binding transcriptional LysR family regulator|uniref:LysR family transcriptional regulator n=1 Tax=Pseudomonas migulae TaxID=78543 RepID=UPI00345F87A9|nr:DNA-binding transcriptional LysR family regulator [Pseudomonas migulae]
MSEYLFPFRLFIRVAYTGSFSRAGRELGISQSSASRIIAALERDLGAKLLVRSTRAVVLTPAGSTYLANIEPILAVFDEANLATRGGSELQGRLRLGLHSGVCLREVVPKLSEFLEFHPGLSVDLVAEQPHRDGVRDRVDLTLQIAAPEDATTAMRLIGSTPRVLVASPTYLVRRGVPSSPVALMAHSIIAGPSPTEGGAWFFSRSGKAVSISIEGKMTANTCEVAMASTISGIGIMSTGLWSCQAEIDAGVLVRVLETWDMGDIRLYAFLPAGAASKTVARSFVGHLVSEFHKQV